MPRRLCFAWTAPARSTSSRSTASRSRASRCPTRPTRTSEGGRSSNRSQSITNLAFSGGKVYVAGLSNEEFASKLRSVAGYPFTTADRGASVEILHGSHGLVETRSQFYTFVPYSVGGEPSLIAAYLCTPLVKFPVSSLTPGAKVRGTTIAELGAGNRPIDMVVYKKDGGEYLLMSNTSRGVMKIPTKDFATQAGITTPIQGTAGIAYETIKSMTGIQQLDLLDADHSIVVAKTATEARSVCRRLRFRKIFLCTLAASGVLACGREGAAGAGQGSLRVAFDTSPSGPASRVVVTGLSASELRALRTAASAWTTDDWAALVRVSVGGNDAPAIAGRYAVGDAWVEFRPLFPFDPGRAYTVRLDPSHLPTPRSDSATTTDSLIARRNAHGVGERRANSTSCYRSSFPRTSSGSTSEFFRADVRASRVWTSCISSMIRDTKCATHFFRSDADFLEP